MIEMTTVQSSNSERIMKALHSVWAAVQPWTQRNVTFGLVLAIATEAPRWVFAFVGAHEPVWAGIAVAVLMSFAAAQGWDEYWKRRDSLLLSMLVCQVASAMVIITPVIFAMAMGAGHGMQIKDIVAHWYLWVWAGTLVVSTFLPLIVVAYVEVQRHESVQGSVQPDVQPKPKKVAQPPAESVHPTTPIVQVPSEPVDDTLPIDSDDGLCDGAPDPSDKEAYVRWLYMEKGLTQSALATQFGVHRNTISKWLNGATKVSA